MVERINIINIILANILYAFHFLLVIFILVGHSLLPIKYLKYYLILVLIIFLGWNDLNGQCFLTSLEYYLRTGEWNKKTTDEGGPEFVRPLIKKIFNLDLSKPQVDRLNNFVFLICWLIAFARIYHLL